MKECIKNCVLKRKNCHDKMCRSWINYKEDLNCSVWAVYKNGNMTLEQVAQRLGLSIVRVKQIQDKALEKLQKNRRLKAF
jgi:DNA-directed RNA polymerase specialized sigma subunit